MKYEPCQLKYSTGYVAVIRMHDEELLMQI